MLITKNAEIHIDSTPTEIWKYAHDPANWTASNPKEHLGLRFLNKKNRPEEGVAFHQKETVAGLYADLRGHILYVDYPNVLVWRGVARYKLFLGIIRVRIPEGGVLRIKVESDGSLVSHKVYMDFPDTLFGKLLYWLFTTILEGEKAVFDHTYRELEFFKKQLEHHKV